MTEPEGLWQDRDIRFDISNQDLQYGAGEEQIDRLPNVEDTKGNSGDKEIMRNRRSTLHYDQVQQHPLRIHIYQHEPDHGAATPHCICPQHFQPSNDMHRAYSATKLYRDLHLRAALLHNRQLRLLPMEQLCSQVNGVWNLSSDQGNLGTMHITNVRIVWHANMNESFNISLPYLQVAAIKTRESKFGTALVIETTDRSGGYVLGFKVDPMERLQHIYKELSSLLKVHKTKPIMGVDVFMQKQTADEEATTQDTGPEIQDEPEVNSADGTHYDAFAAYLADGGHDRDREVVLSPELGLAVEKLPEGFTLASLWEVLPPSS
ncbi:Bardet-Biedl syndrome 5 protein isoform X3 [Rhipicephalus microplus]|uniref:Bardet-Biedl syndrome 5 protein isoform X3 n=1 Tax=Rhipicephalus microplus TaxID=6941 RepID=UPI003F6DA0EF